MRHWLQAEQELSRGSSGNGTQSGANIPARNSDVTPLQGTRAAAAVAATRDSKRTPSPTEKNGSGQASNSRRKSAPPL